MNRRGFLRSAAVTISVMALAAHIRGARQWWVPEGFRPADYDEWGLSTAEFLAGAQTEVTLERVLQADAIRTFRQLGKTNMKYEYMRYLAKRA